MAVDGGSPALAIRSSVGIELWSSAGPKLPYEHKSDLPREETKNSRSISFSPDGRYFAYSNGLEVKVLSTSNWELKCTLPRPKAFYLKFSSRGSFLCTWELYVVNKDKPEGSSNMFIYEIESGMEVFGTVQKNQTDWEPSWSSDETLLAMVVGGEALFYDLSEGLEGFKKSSRKIGGSRGGALSIGPGICPPYLAFYTPGAKGAPSICKLYKYPDLGQNQAVSNKSFMQADRVEMLWNSRGTGLLLLTSTEVDKSGASYYGNQGLHFMATADESLNVPLSKKGPVHCVKWSPKAKEFVVVYGYMPSKASLYNLKCDVIFDFDEGPRNCAYFNPFGNILVLAGFGNLPGNVEIWDVVKKEKIANIKCPDTTFFEWNPNGEYFLAATTAPRLRIGNGFKVYHYSGALMHETIWPQGQELLGVEWQKFPDKTFNEPVITKAKQEGIKSSQPEASKKAYTPPHLRLMKEGKNPEKFLPQPYSSTSGASSGQNQVNHNNSAKKVNSEHSKMFKINKQTKKKSNQVVGVASENIVGNNMGAGNNVGEDNVNNVGFHNSEGNLMIAQTSGNNMPMVFIQQTHQQQQQQQQQQAQQQPQQQQQQHVRTKPPQPTLNFSYHPQHLMQQTQQHHLSPQQPQQNQQLQQNQFHQSSMIQKKNMKQIHQNQNQFLQNSNNSGGGGGHHQDVLSSTLLSQHHQHQQHPHTTHAQQQLHQFQANPQQQQQQHNPGLSLNQQQKFSTSSSSKRSQQSERDKKIRNIAKKLSDIKKLKMRQEQGETLELNQMQKIAMEEKFLNEFKALKLNE